MAGLPYRSRGWRPSLPELPEVELTRRHLARALPGRSVRSVEVGHPRTVRYNASADEVQARLRGRQVEAVGRRGKFIVAELDHGFTLVAHLGMSGRFSIDPKDAQRVPHTHFVAELDDGTQIRFIDPRTFGFVAVYDEDEMERSGLARLGPDAWDDPPDPPMLARALETRSAPIKSLLLDQRPLAGLGNIYADEVLHRARIHPLTPGRDLAMDQVIALLGATRVVLQGAIESRGTTLDDFAYLLPDGRAGENLGRLAVYGREGEPCFSCGNAIERVVLRGRSTHYCPVCQGV